MVNLLVTLWHHSPYPHPHLPPARCAVLQSFDGVVQDPKAPGAPSSPSVVARWHRWHWHIAPRPWDRHVVIPGHTARIWSPTERSFLCKFGTWENMSKNDGCDGGATSLHCCLSIFPMVFLSSNTIEHPTRDSECNLLMKDPWPDPLAATFLVRCASSRAMRPQAPPFPRRIQSIN